MLINHALRSHQINRRLLSSKVRFDLAVIGSGPGGYVAAIRAAQLGKKVVSIEKHSSLGGTCLNVGCIPSKTLLNCSHIFNQLKKDNMEKIGIKLNVQPEIDVEKMIENKNQVVKKLTQGIEFLFKKYKVNRIKGKAMIMDGNKIKIMQSYPNMQNKNNDDELELETEKIIIATGSEIVDMEGINVDEENIVSSTGALDFQEVPKQLAIIGGGIIGLEMGSIWSRLGSHVKIIEFTDNIGGPSMDKEVSLELQKYLTTQGIQFFLRHKFTSDKFEFDDKNKMIKFFITKLDDIEKDSVQIQCDKLLLCIGRRPATNELINHDLLSHYKLVDEKGFIKVNSKLQTAIPTIFAIGDCTNTGPMLAHRAEDEAINLIERLYNGDMKELDYNCIPSVIYTHPEVAWVGASEQKLTSKEKQDLKVGKFKMSSNSRAICTSLSHNIPGFVKILSRKSDGRILGAHLMCDGAGDMIYGLTTVMKYGGSCEDLHNVSFPHPTQSEAIKEALFIADSHIGQPINS